MKKHIVCFGDSNTHGYCAEPADCADGGDRFNESERWTCLLGQALGEDCLVLEEGLGGRTSVFPDPLHECMSGLDVIYSTLMSHEPVDLLIIMLGTNDTKERCTPHRRARRWDPAARKNPGSWQSTSNLSPNRTAAPSSTRRGSRSSTAWTACT